MFDFLRNKKPLHLKSTLSKFRAYCAGKTAYFLQQSYIAREKFKDLTKTNYELGLLHLKKGNLSDAVLRFKITLWIKSDFAPAYYNLGRTFLMQGKLEKAAKAFTTALQHQPDFPEVDYMLASLGQDKSSIHFIPRSIVEDYFDDLAPHYNKDFVAMLHYVGDHSLVDAISDVLENRTLALDVLDLGCGTGLCGKAIRERILVNTLTGVDVSEKMLKESRRLTVNDKPVYTNLRHQDMITFLQKSEKKYDIIAAALSFNYIAELDTLLALCKNSLRPGGLLAFSTEESPIQNVTLNDSMQNFCHSLDYIHEQIAQAGLTELSLKKTVVLENFLAVQCVAKNA